MAGRLSSGILLYRVTAGEGLEVLIAHMGGPLWERRDRGAWSIPKGEHDPGEDGLTAARREFEEELGFAPPRGELVDLGTLRQPSGKRVHVWAAPGDIDARRARSTTFRMEWPRGSGRMGEFPEVDRAAWFDVATAREKLVSGQVPFLDRLMAALAPGGATRPDPPGVATPATRGRPPR